MPARRRARVRAFAKLNLTLQVLHKRADNYHELRTVFQTISLADRIAIAFTPARRTTIQIDGAEIPNNLMQRAAELVLDAARVKGAVRMTLDKRIPMGGGLGGGSADAAAVLLALPALARRPLPLDTLRVLAEKLGSDVPFLLVGGTAAAQGRGEQLYPLPSLRAQHGLVLVPPVAVSTPEAYRELARPTAAELTPEGCFNRMKTFQSFTWSLAGSVQKGDWMAFCENDFEAVVFRRFPLLASLQRKLLSWGAVPARMTGSGSALFGFFRSRPDRQRAQAACRKLFPDVRVEAVQFVTRESYQSAWRRWLDAPL